MADTQPHLLPLLLTHHAFRPMFDSLLQLPDLLELLCVSKTLHQHLIRDSPILARLYFLSFLNYQDPFAFDFFESREYKRYEQEQVDLALCSQKAALFGRVGIMKQIRREMGNNLRVMVDEDSAHHIVEDVFQTLIEPCMPVPSLRKQTVGDYCGSPLQLLLAELNLKDLVFISTEEPYRTLRTQILESHQDILKQLEDNKDSLLKIRFQPESIDNYESTNSPFLNLINLLFTVTDCHLDSIRNYFQGYSEVSPLQFLLEYLRRYTTFRNMVVSLEEKLGFLLEMFTKACNHLEPELEEHPGCTIWRALMKKWVNKMKVFRGRNAEGFSQLFQRIRDTNARQFIMDNQAFQNASCETTMKCNLNLNLSESGGSFASQVLKSLEAWDPSSLSMVVCDFMEYMVDCSVNEYSVQWCGSSIQKLSVVYNFHEQVILDSTEKLYRCWSSTFSEAHLLKQLLQQDINHLRQLIKPNILTKIIQKANTILQECSPKSKHIQGGFERIDDRIRYLNEERLVPLELEQQQKKFHDFDKSVGLSDLREIIKSLSVVVSLDKLQQNGEDADTRDSSQAQAAGEQLVFEERCAFDSLEPQQRSF